MRQSRENVPICTLVKVDSTASSVVAQSNAEVPDSSAMYADTLVDVSFK